METVQVALLLVAALLTHNLVNSFPQHYDYVIGADYVGGGATGSNTSGASSGGSRGSNGKEERFTCPEPTPTSDCSCMYASTDYEIQCPVINPEITVKIKPGMYAQIQCYEKHEFSEMPTLNVGNTTQVKIIHCPLPPRKSIRQFVSFLGVKHVKDFWYQNYGKDLGVRLVRQHFEGMQDLEKLFLSSGIEDIQPDLFADLPNLRWLILRSNHVKLLHNVFDNLTNLVILELGANQITELEPGLFKNQRKLRHLNLWRNQLRNITRESFRGAETLQELDLSVNAIESLNPDVFTLLPDLTVLNLGFNRFPALPENLLSDNRNLKEFKFINNQGPLQTLPENFLSNLPQLKTVILNRCSFTHLPASLFRGSSDITHMDLSYNQLSSVPKQLLRDQLRLQDLNLAYNELEMIPDGLFENTKELLTLQLSNNRLYNLSALIFSSLEKLTVLNIDNNHLHVIDKLTFSGTIALEKLYMQNNRLSFNELSFVMQELDITDSDGTPFQYLNNLRVLNLRNNSITTIFRDWNYNTLKLRELDLSYNNISTLSYLSLQFVSEDIRVNLSHNRITEIDLKDMEPLITSQRQQSEDGKIRVDVNNNPLNCNCVIFTFVQYLLNELDRAVYQRIQFSADNLSCMEPEEHKGTQVMQLQTKDLLCQLDQPGTEIKRCPAKCSCFVRPVDRGVIVNCTRQGLVEVPPLPQPAMFGFNFLELHIEENNITKLPTESLAGYARVAELYATGNGITVLEPENLPTSLRILDLTKNKLTMLNHSVVEALNNSKQLASLQLSDNRWRCDCASSQFLNFVQQNHKKVVDIGQVTCEDGRTFDSITVSILCNENTTTIIAVSIILSIVGLLIGLFTVLYFAYQTEIKVYMFTHNIFMWLVSEEDLDKDKLYDAFISYSHKDEEFITEHLVPTLEKEPMNFKTCWHVRDWMPGELIPTQITKSVDDSRRTIVVLSANFLESGWGRMEFRTAHLNSMAEKRVRVIVILYGDIGDIEELDSEVKAYLKMNTYVKWGDPWFWDKLRYAMPHPPAVRGLKNKGLVKNHIKSSVDDKLELIKPVPVTPPPLTTPPAEMNGQITPPFTISNGKVMNGNGYHANGHIMNGHITNGHVNGAFMINSNAKQSDV
ncbi:protein toll-like [Malaya genurostris]|uniref:protein toll-like n=1 Tax=Malaya genurostris TaxID=325434 RepID=UPI0026F3A441|nr:protein toll-like [Malaya genurostris]XP_058444003.1 protein toll-like [Malaya genurostris]XP_058444004.1 protein toll-like [Malaya genurostris]